MLKLFAETNEIEAFVGIGCCYYKGINDGSFPLSKEAKVYLF